MNNDNLGLLGKIEYPDDLRKLRVEQLEEVCSELRHVIVEELAVNPGHLASSLGVVELTVALHYVFNTPFDRIVWDVDTRPMGIRCSQAVADVSPPTVSCTALGLSRARWRASTTLSRADTRPTPFRRRSVWLWLHAKPVTTTVMWWQ